MEINKRTLFLHHESIQRLRLNEDPTDNELVVGDWTTGVIDLFDLKTLTGLTFFGLEEAIDFCKKYNETECIQELMSLTLEKKLPPMIYLDTNIKANRHRLVDIEAHEIVNVKSDKLFKMVSECNVINLEIGTSNKIRVKWVPEQTPEGFKEEIDKKCKEFSKRAMLHNPVEMEYIIIGKYVILTSYKAERQVVPSFITSIAGDVFEDTDEITITDGVEFIGNYAFDSTAGVKIIGGKDVKYIGCNDCVCSMDEYKSSNYFV